MKKAMKKLCIAVAMLICAMSISVPCLAEDETENIFAASAGKISEVSVSKASGTFPTTDGKAGVKAKDSTATATNALLKDSLTNGVTDLANDDRVYVEKPSNFTSYKFNTNSDKTSPGTPVSGISIVFKFNADASNKPLYTGINRLVIYAGAADTDSSGNVTNTLDASKIAVSESANSSSYTEVGFKPIDVKYIYQYTDTDKSTKTRAMQILTLDFDSVMTSKFIKIFIAGDSGAFRIREIEAYNTHGSNAGNFISSAAINNRTDPKRFTLTLTDEAKDKNCTYIAARYDKDGNFSKAAYATANDGKVVFDGTDMNPWGGENTKVFVWDGFEKMTPLSDTFSIVPKNARPYGR